MSKIKCRNQTLKHIKIMDISFVIPNVETLINHVVDLYLALNNRKDKPTKEQPKAVSV